MRYEVSQMDFETTASVLVIQRYWRKRKSQKLAKKQSLFELKKVDTITLSKFEKCQFCLIG